MSWKWNIWTRTFDYYRGFGTGGPGQLSPYNLIFYEEFTGTGSDTDFTLTGAIQNGTFTSGTWAIANIQTTYPAHVTDDDKTGLYDSTNIFTRNRIQVSSINPTTGEVTLNYAPLMGDDFRIWYWYTLNTHDKLSGYIREDFVASMEQDAGAIIAEDVYVNTASLSGILGSGDTDVQTALETLDIHTHYNESTVEVDCLSGDIVGDLVCISANAILGRWQVQQADPYDRTKMPAVGVLIHKYTFTTGVVQYLGEVTGVYTSLTILSDRRRQFVGPSGPINYPPSASGGSSGYALVQPIGIAPAPTILTVFPSMQMTLRR
jgi:hypothetical protein